MLKATFSCSKNLKKIIILIICDDSLLICKVKVKFISWSIFVDFTWCRKRGKTSTLRRKEFPLNVAIQNAVFFVSQTVNYWQINSKASQRRQFKSIMSSNFRFIAKMLLSLRSHWVTSLASTHGIPLSCLKIGVVF